MVIIMDFLRQQDLEKMRVVREGGKFTVVVYATSREEIAGIGSRLSMEFSRRIDHTYGQGMPAEDYLTPKQRYDALERLAGR